MRNSREMAWRQKHIQKIAESTLYDRAWNIGNSDYNRQLRDMNRDLENSIDVSAKVNSHMNRGPFRASRRPSSNPSKYHSHSHFLPF